jgi:outer membrane protein OmpA-like peptidoglycan-associated protein
MRLGLVVSIAILVAASVASADPIISLPMEPAPAGDRGLAVEHAAIRDPHLLSVRFAIDISHHPLVVDNRAFEPDVVVDSQLWLHALATYAISTRLAVHLDLPILLNQGDGDHPPRGRAAPGPDGPAGFGDLRLGARLSLLNPALQFRRHFDVAIGASAWLPTGNDAYTSDGRLRGAAGLLADGEAYGFYWAANAGVKERPPVKLGFASPLYGGTALSLGAAAGIFLDHAHALSLGPELAVDSSFAGEGPASPNGMVAHLLFGAHYLPTDGPLEVGAGAGPDFGKGPGKADYQVMIFVGMVPERALLPPSDRDHDGIIDVDDACVSVPGVPSDDPQKNGCPKVIDTDSDGIPDTEDSCPTAFGPRSPYPRLNGCPPPQDTDNDGWMDDEDACPWEPGPAPPVGNGCPDEPKAALAAEQIVISQQVVFETGSAVLLSESDKILGDVAKILTDHPEVELLEVQGHTDERGTVEFNRKLSQDRAASVVTWLVQHGIDRNRLTAKGYGRDRPIADNSTEEGMQKNRRVEFHVLRNKTAPKQE